MVDGARYETGPMLSAVSAQSNFSNVSHHRQNQIHRDRTAFPAPSCPSRGFHFGGITPNVAGPGIRTDDNGTCARARAGFTRVNFLNLNHTLPGNLRRGGLSRFNTPNLLDPHPHYNTRRGHIATPDRALTDRSTSIEGNENVPGHPTYDGDGPG
jgi:hypothetical protein